MSVYESHFRSNPSVKDYAIQHIGTMTFNSESKPTNVELHSYSYTAFRTTKKRDADGKMSRLTISPNGVTITDTQTHTHYTYALTTIAYIAIEIINGLETTRCCIVVYRPGQGTIVHIFDCYFARDLTKKAKHIFQEARRNRSKLNKISGL